MFHIDKSLFRMNRLCFFLFMVLLIPWWFISTLSYAGEGITRNITLLYMGPRFHQKSVVDYHHNGDPITPTKILQRYALCKKQKNAPLPERGEYESKSEYQDRIERHKQLYDIDCESLAELKNFHVSTPVQLVYDADGGYFLFNDLTPVLIGDITIDSTTIQADWKHPLFLDSSVGKKLCKAGKVHKFPEKYKSLAHYRVIINSVSSNIEIHTETDTEFFSKIITHANVKAAYKEAGKVKRRHWCNDEMYDVYKLTSKVCNAVGNYGIDLIKEGTDQVYLSVKAYSPIKKARLIKSFETNLRMVYAGTFRLIRQPALNREYCQWVRGTRFPGWEGSLHKSCYRKGYHLKVKTNYKVNSPRSFLKLESIYLINTENDSVLFTIDF